MSSIVSGLVGGAIAIFIVSLLQRGGTSKNIEELDARRLYFQPKFHFEIDGMTYPADQLANDLEKVLTAERFTRADSSDAVNFARKSSFGFGFDRTALEASITQSDEGIARVSFSYGQPVLFDTGDLLSFVRSVRAQLTRTDVSS